MYPAYLRLLGPDVITLEVKYTPIRPIAEANTKTIGRESIGNTSHTNKQHNKKNMKAKPANNDSRNGNIKVGITTRQQVLLAILLYGFIRCGKIV